MTKNIKFYFDFLSPYSYLASTQLPALAERVGAEIDYIPINVLKLMELVGNQPTTVLCEAKLQYAFQDLARWSEIYQVPITPNPHLTSIDVNPLLLGAISACDVGIEREYAAAVFSAYWTQEAEFKDSAELLSILEAAGLPEAVALLERSKGMENELAKNISAAVDDGIFGVPSFVCTAGIYFGNDRLDFLEAAIASP